MHCETCGSKAFNLYTTHSSGDSAAEIHLCSICHAAAHGLVRLHRETLSLAEALRRARKLRTA